MTDANPHRFPEAEVSAIYRAIAERRDMRHFRPDPVDPAVLARLLWAAHHAPSVGYMQPWRFIRITDRGLASACTGWSRRSAAPPPARWASAKRTSCASRWKVCWRPAR
ncbi:nitroreductase family protein [Zoogloea oleivorans]|uniref:nitroreductase family protein n=1 Tax=Zoogloea oleivorans TaxID=1552750 RepID=UPI00387E1799